MKFLEGYVVVVLSGKISIYFDEVTQTEIDQEHLTKVHVKKLISTILGAKSIRLSWKLSQNLSFWSVWLIKGARKLLGKLSDRKMVP